ncbi:uncharacterized protein SOCEGT47_065940 [Sorangium cellulosum]|uniref:Uncharacterized protein n=1 Tax=Sorangium cellulosum TaxID=56 RepID=A0A4P2Q9V1_SORCE|nr:hypothetical protein [Sorangium cellulosum]AUX26041.1 uncharacterized protein SOCEGT47_065940 [Sorangium cellulosum]
MSQGDEDEEMVLRAERVVAETVERSLAPYRGLVPPEMLAQMREALEEELVKNPYSAALLRQLTARPAPEVSGEVPAEGAPLRGRGHGGRGGAAGGGREGA